MRVVSPRGVSGALGVSMSVTSWEQFGKNSILLPSFDDLGGLVSQSQRSGLNLSEVAMDAQMTTHAHPDRPYGNIVRPMKCPADRVDDRNVEDHPPPADPV